MKLSSTESILEKLIFINIISLYCFEDMSFSIVFKIIMIILIFFGLIIELPKSKNRSNSVVILTLLFMIYSFFMKEYLVGEWTTLLGINVQTAITILLATFVFIVVYLYANDEYKRDRLLKCTTFAGVLLAVITVIVAGGRIFEGLHSEGMSQFLVLNGLQSNKMGFCFGISFLTSLYLWDKNKKYWFLLPLMLNFLFLFFTGSRRAFIFCLVGPSVFYVSGNGLKSLSRVFLILILLVLAYWAVMTIPYLYDTVGVRIDSLLDVLQGGRGTDSTGTRVLMIEYGVELINRDLWFGLGLNAFSYYFQDIIGKWIYSHNNYIELLVSGGIVYTCLYYSKFIILLKNIRPKLQSNKEMRIYMAILVSLLVADIADVTYYYRIYYLILAIIAAGIYSSNKRSTKKVNAIRSKMKL